MKKKQNFKSFVKLFVLLIGVSVLLWNCKNDETFQEEVVQEELEKPIALYKNASEIPQSVFNFINKRTNNTKQVFVNKETLKLTGDSSLFRNDTFGYVDESQAVVISNEEETRYTFSVMTNQLTVNDFINLIIIEKEDSTIEYFIKYSFNNIADTPRLTTNAIDVSSFSGVITYYNAEGIVSGVYTFDNGTVVTNVGRSSTPTNDCPEDNNGGGSNGGGGNSDDDPYNNDPDNDPNDNGNNDGGGGDDDVSTTCGLAIQYAQCGCLGNADGHAPSGASCCAGSPGVLGVLCTTGSNRGRGIASRTNSDACSSTDGVILSSDQIDLADIFACFDNNNDALNPVLGSWLNGLLSSENRGNTDLDDIASFLDINGCSDEARGFVKDAINFLKDNSQYSFLEYENWFGTDHEGVDYQYDESYWEDPNLIFNPQNLPSWDDFNAAYPRKPDGSGWLYGADNIYNLIGGDVLQVRLDYPIITNNTCALKVSIALNGAGITIPQITTTNGNHGTVQGADGKFYFLNAKSLNKWMKLTFGVSPINPNHYNYTAAEGGIGGKNFPNLIGSKKGIYSLNSSSVTWATGHADIFFENKCAAGCHYNAPELESIDLWVLN